MGNGYDTVVLLKNKDQQNTATANLTLFYAAGSKQTTQILVGPGSTSRLDLTDIVKPQGRAMQDGGLAVDSTVVLSGQVVVQGPQTSSVNLALLGGYRYDTENALYAPWWLPDAGSEGNITVFNSSGETVTVTPAISIAGGSEQSGTSFTLAPFASTTLELRKLIGKSSGIAGSTSGMLTLRYSGPPRALLPTLLLSNPSTGFSLSPGFNARHQQPASQQVTWQYPDVSLVANSVSGTQPQAQPLTAYALLTNGTKDTLAPELVAFYALASGARVSKAPLSLAPLMPSETRLVDLSELLSNASVPAGISHFSLALRHAGGPGDLAISVFSANEGNNVVLTAGGMMQPAGVVDASYWKLGTPDSVPGILNKNKVDAQTQVTMYYQTAMGVESYLLPVIAVPAGKTQPLGLREIMHSAVADAAGNKAPSGIVAGLVTLTVVSGVEGASAPDAGPECQTDCGSVTPSISPAMQPSALASFPSSSLASMSAGPASSITPAVQFTASIAGTNCPPLITSLSQTSGLVDTNGNSVTINGSNFAAGQQVQVSGGVTATVQQVDPNGTFIVASFDIPLSATAGTDQVMVVDSLLGNSNTANFSVGDPTPNVTSVVPSPWVAGSTTSAQIFGSGFGTNTPTVTITGGGVSNVQVVGPTDPTLKDGEIDITFAIDPNTPTDTATIEVTSTGYNGNNFAPAPGQKPQAPKITVPVNAAPAPVPVILYFGTPITPTGDGSCGLGGQSASHCGAVGQKMSLSSQVNSNTLISSQFWSVQGTAIAGFKPPLVPDFNGGEQVSPLQIFTNATITFYWISTGGSSPASYQVKYSYCLVNGNCNSVTATFSIEGPTVSGGTAPVTVRTLLGSIFISPKDGPLMAFQPPPVVKQPGIKFFANNFNLPQGNKGSFQWVQLLNTDQSQNIASLGPFNCSSFVGGGPPQSRPGPQLDNGYPYGFGFIPSTVTTQVVSNDTASDSPSSNLIDTWGEVQRFFNATMYLEWISADDSACPTQAPNADDCSIPVPLGNVTWQWEGDAINTKQLQINQTTWSFAPGCPKATPQPVFQAASTSFPSFGYLSWQAVATPGCK